MADAQSNIGNITQSFGAYNPAIEKFSGGFNRGTDFEATEGSSVVVPEGTWFVVESFDSAPENKRAANRGYGNSILLRNLMTGEMMRFSHLSQVNVRPGQVVKSGESVGATGKTGNATGPHLDIEYFDQQGKLEDVQKSPYAKLF